MTAGLTVTVKLTGVPLQLPTTGVAVMVAVCGVATLAAMKLIVPLPLAWSPMAGLSFVQLTVAPAEALKPTMLVVFPQKVKLLGCARVGAGLTVMVKVWGAPVQVERMGLIKLPNAMGPCPAGTVATTVFVAVSITETLPLIKLATYT